MGHGCSALSWSLRISRRLCLPSTSCPLHPTLGSNIPDPSLPSTNPDLLQTNPVGFCHSPNTDSFILIFQVPYSSPLKLNFPCGLDPKPNVILCIMCQERRQSPPPPLPSPVLSPQVENQSEASVSFPKSCWGQGTSMRGRSKKLAGTSSFLSCQQPTGSLAALPVPPGQHLHTPSQTAPPSPS